MNRKQTKRNYEETINNRNTTVSWTDGKCPGKWSTVKVEADELKGVKGGESYHFSVDGVGTIEITDWKKDRILITTNEGEFEYSKHEVKNSITNISKTTTVRLNFTKAKVGGHLPDFD